jgi:hypothetical protein
MPDTRIDELLREVRALRESLVEAHEEIDALRYMLRHADQLRIANQLHEPSASLYLVPTTLSPSEVSDVPF